MRFDSELLTAPIRGSRYHRVVMPLRWVASDGRKVEVPVGFITDKTTCAPEGDHTRAAVIHDYLYETQIVERKAADQYFLEAMIDDKVAAGIRWLLYAGVRVGGQKIWNNIIALRERVEGAIE